MPSCEAASGISTKIPYAAARLGMTVLAAARLGMTVLAAARLGMTF